MKNYRDYYIIPDMEITKIFPDSEFMEYLKGIVTNPSGTAQNERIRHMTCANWNLGDLANMFFIVYWVIIRFFLIQFI